MKSLVILCVLSYTQALQNGYVIALDKQAALATAHDASHFLGIPNVSVFPAINATAALQLNPLLSLYTQYLLYFHTRHDHMQLSTAPMLGCLLSHMQLWGMAIASNETIAIFEEDSIFDATSTDRFHRLLQDLSGNYTWDLLMLESGSVIAQGPYVLLLRLFLTQSRHRLIYALNRWKSIGRYAATCAQQPCSWFGTRGYLVTQRCICLSFSICVMKGLMVTQKQRRQAFAGTCVPHLSASGCPHCPRSSLPPIRIPPVLDP